MPSGLWVFIKILVDILALIFMFVSFSVSSVFCLYCDSWSMAESHDIFLELNSCVCSRCRIGAWLCDSINEDLSGEVPSATRRGMQPHCVKCLLYVSYVEWVNEWVNELVNEWVNEWVNCMMNEWIAWWMNSMMNEWIVWWMNCMMNEWIMWWMNYCGMYGLIYVIVFAMCCTVF